jgi:hypothetical protein
MKADDVTATLELALEAPGLDKAGARRPRLLSNNGSSCSIGSRVAERNWLSNVKCLTAPSRPLRHLYRMGCENLDEVKA